jgi:hypothetical protein
MSRRANILLLLALAAGVVYGWFGVPFLLPLVSDGIEATVEEPPGQVFSEADEIRFRMLSLKTGMDFDEIARVLGRPVLLRGHWSFGVYWFGWIQIDPNQTLLLSVGRTEGLFTAELHNSKQVVATMPVSQITPGK